MILVEECTNWMEISPIRGKHCYNCAMRDGYPFRGQPDSRCTNFNLEINKDKIDKMIEAQLKQQIPKADRK